MLHTVTTFLFFATVAEAKWQARHHDSLTGHKQSIPQQYIKGHLRDNFVINPHTRPHHDALTGNTQSIPDLFIKGHVQRDNFVIKPQDRHHDALTGHAQSIPGLFIKGHVADPPPIFKDYLKQPTVNDKSVENSLPNFWSADPATPSMTDEFTFCKVSGDQCSQYILKNWMRFGATLGGFKEGTCWDHGYTANEGSKEISIPLIGKTNVRVFGLQYFEGSQQEVPRMQVFAQSSSDDVSLLAVALISILGVSGAIFAILRVRRGTLTADKESLLATSQL